MVYSVEAWSQPPENPDSGQGFAYYDTGSSMPPLDDLIPNVDTWYRETEQPLFTEHKRNDSYLEDYQLSPFIMALQSDNGNFSYVGGIRPGLAPISVSISGGFVYTGNLGLTLQSTSIIDFQLAYVGTVDLTLVAPDVGVVGYISGVPGSSEAIILIDGVNVSNDVQGTVTVTREDNRATRFVLTINSESMKAVDYINKEILISFQVADNDGVVVDYIPIFRGVCKGARLNYESGEYIIRGYDYGGIHQTKGELISKDITNVLTGSVYVSAAGTYNTGKNPIWGVTYSGSANVEDGRDYFVDTLNGRIVVPISSALIQFPATLTFQYMNPFGTLKLLMQEVLNQKGWNLVEDEVTLVDYTHPSKQPVLSVSNESVIDITRKFLELSGAKLDSNLFPNLRVYSELVNYIGPAKHVIDDTIVFGGTLTFDMDMTGLINKQTVRSVQKTNASIVISGSQQLAAESGEQGATVLLNQVIPFGSHIPIDFSVRVAIVTVRISRTNIASISFNASGTFSLSFLSGSISTSDWSMSIEDNFFVFKLQVTPWWIITKLGTPLGSDGAYWYVAYPAADWSLTVNGTKISYSDASVEGIVEVTASRTITGLADVLGGDVQENPYIETDAHAANLTNAILVEYGNVYFANGQVPIYAGNSMNIGDKIDIYDNGNELFSGLIKVLKYQLNMDTGKNTLFMGMQGIGFTI